MHRVLLLMLCFVFSLFCFASGKKVMERKQRESAARSAGLSGRQTGSSWKEDSTVRGERAERGRERKSNEPSVPQQRAIIV